MIFGIHSKKGKKTLDYLTIRRTPILAFQWTLKEAAFSSRPDITNHSTDRSWITWLSVVLSEWLTGTLINFSFTAGQLVRLCWFPGDEFDGWERTLDMCGKEIYTWNSYFISLLQGYCIAEALVWNDTSVLAISPIIFKMITQKIIWLVWLVWLLK